MVPSARAWLSFLAELNPLAVILRVPRVESRSVSSMPGRAYFVYVMSSLSRTLYTGVTNDLERRVAEHKEGKPGSFTARYNVTRCTEDCVNRVDEPAVGRFEQRVKQGRKRAGILREARVE